MTDKIKNIANRIIMKQLANISKNKDKGIRIAIASDSKSSINTFHVLYIFNEIINDDKKEFKNAELIFKFTIPDDFPTKSAIEGYAITPNGVIKVNEKYCLEFGNYHKSTQTIIKNRIDVHIRNTLSAILNWQMTGLGIGLLYGEKSAADQLNDIKLYSSKSSEWNNKYYPDLIKEFELCDKTTLSKHPVLSDKIDLPVTIPSKPVELSDKIDIPLTISSKPIAILDKIDSSDTDTDKSALSSDK